LTLEPEQTLDSALERMAARGMSWAPVVQDQRRIGRLYVRNVVQTYKNTLERSVHRVTALPAETVLLEARLSATSPLVGRTLKEARLPHDVLVVAIVRAGETIFPHGDTRLEAGDVVMMVTDPSTEDALSAFLEGSAIVKNGGQDETAHSS
jgi:NhaP-type Na+/H+ and K+/H+ antiporter